MVDTIHLEPDSEPAFDKREVSIQKGKWVTQEFEILNFLGR
jgi:hypothetical protein